MVSDSLTNDALEQMNGKTRKKNSRRRKTRSKRIVEEEFQKLKKKRINIFLMQLVFMITTKLKMP